MDFTARLAHHLSRLFLSIIRRDVHLACASVVAGGRVLPPVIVRLHQEPPAPRYGREPAEIRPRSAAEMCARDISEIAPRSRLFLCGSSSYTSTLLSRLRVTTAPSPGRDPAMMKYEGADTRVVLIACDISAIYLGEFAMMRNCAERRAVRVVPMISANISADSPRALGST